MRTGGLGWAIGVGCIARIGSIVTPLLGGWLPARALPPNQIFLSACLIALLAAAATALLALRPAASTAAEPEAAAWRRDPDQVRGVLTLFSR